VFQKNPCRFREKEDFMIPNSTILLLIVGLILVTAAFIGLLMTTRTYLKFRRKSLVTCPETRKPAAVQVDAGKAALDVLEGRHARIHLDQCSRWPEREQCGQECLSQIENDPEGCSVWSIVQQWYRGRSCAYCQKPIEAIHWHDHRPALLGPDKKTAQWTEIPAERLPEVFETHLPVCWSCHIAETFRRDHPERVVDRPWKRGAMGEYIAVSIARTRTRPISVEPRLGADHGEISRL
jgi:hypothetical protein